MRPSLVCVLCGLLAIALASPAFQQFTPQQGDLKKWIGPGAPGSAEEGSLKAWKAPLLKRMMQAISDLIGVVGLPSADQDLPQYPFYRWIPVLTASIIPGAETAKWSPPCFPATSASGSFANANGTGPYTLTFTAQAVEGGLTGCQDWYLLATVTSTAKLHIQQSGTVEVTWSTDGLSSAELWDLQTKGVRVFRFVDDPETTMYELEQTIQLFVPDIESTKPPEDHYAQLNLQFLKDYTWREHPVRQTEEVTLSPSDLQFGDFIGWFRTDGLDTMLQFGMGSTTGHTAVVARNLSSSAQEWLVCESTDPYILCTPFDAWMALAKSEGASITHAPLDPVLAQSFNQTAAWARIQDLLGFSYGYYNFFWGWVDTVDGNFPCLPPDFASQCLVWQHLEVLSGIVEKMDWELAQRMYGQSFNLRLGTYNLSTAEAYQEAARRGMHAYDLYTQVEQDSWNYNTTKYGTPTPGPSMVCDVFVCHVWKAGGVFASINNDFNCVEFTNWDDYVLKVFNPDYVKPPQCQAADPAAPTCQLEGKYQLLFNDYMTKIPAPHMGERCPGQPPFYYKPSDC